MAEGEFSITPGKKTEEEEDGAVAIRMKKQLKAVKAGKELTDEERARQEGARRHNEERETDE